MIDFARTPMGRRFFEATLPDLVLQVGRVANALTDIAETLRAAAERSAESTSKKGTAE